ncbi:hypothetical protein SLEP1_g46241 [Rubroshorea leprosula]|uniref:VQ domain-containing protein n=1 Tax=Rubroshorea leprosula TaxID=152421 RepID=A0AAV5LP04_9ROSI|nr:hypothetical protein SLEP1_g46241 [Rubroshorea leprosula]
MENSRGAQERKNPSPLNSPNSNGSSSNGNALQIHTPPISPIPISRSDTNPYPTTFVQADTTTFKQVVQMLTGSTETAKQASKPPSQQHPSLQQQQQQQQQQHQDPLPSKSFAIPPIKNNIPRKQSFKLYERRNNNIKNSLMINTFFPAGVAGSPSFSPRKPPEILSPSILDFPKLVLSPVTPLNDEDPFNKSSPSLGNSSEEEKAIAEKGFYLHPSPMSTPRDSEPQLLPLFPVTSPKVSGSSS